MPNGSDHVVMTLAHAQAADRMGGEVHPAVVGVIGVRVKCQSKMMAKLGNMPFYSGT